jgi:hypothetical protein
VNPVEGAPLYGREPERAAIDRLLEDARRSRSGVLVLRAEAGVGKSALLDYARSGGADMRILRAVGVEPEIELPFAALHQLLRPVLPYLDRIPEVQAAALRGALAIAPGDTDNRFAIALAVLSLLAEVATDGPLLCLVDDAHWLDQPSADTLSFVARRLEAEGIVLLFAAREGDARSFPGSGLAEREVKGLDPTDAEVLLIERFGSAIAPDTRRVIVESAQGIPLALLEIPMALTAAQLSGREPLPQPMPLGHDLEVILLQRVQRLPAPTQLLLLVAAAEGSGEAAAVLAAGDRLGISASALLDAEASGLLHATGGALAFRHPILRTAIYQSASLLQRQAVHRALVDTLQGEPNADRRAGAHGRASQKPQRPRGGVPGAPARRRAQFLRPTSSTPARVGGARGLERGPARRGGRPAPGHGGGDGDGRRHLRRAAPCAGRDRAAPRRTPARGDAARRGR